MKLNPKSDYLKGHVKADEIAFNPASIQDVSQPERVDPAVSPLSKGKKARKAEKRATTDKLVRRSTNQPVGQRASQSTDRQTDQPTDQSTDLSTMLSAVQSTDKRANRPAAFYITERQSDVLDALVSHFKVAHGVNTDRSALVRGILGEPVLNFYDEGTHEELIRRLIDQLTSQLTSRQVDRQTDRSEEGDGRGDGHAASGP